MEVFLRGNPSLINDNLPLDEQATLLPYNTDMEFPRNRLKLGMQIGADKQKMQMEAQKFQTDQQARGVELGLDVARTHLDRAHAKELATMNKKDQLQQPKE